MKVIYIITFPPKYEYIDGPEPDFFWINNKNEEICIWRMDRGHVFARDVKKYFPELEYEVWRPDYRAEKEYTHIFEDGVIHRSFPARAVQFRRGLKKDRSWTSGGLLERLEQYIDQNSEDQDLILHLPVDFSYLSYTIFQKFAGKVPFLHTSHLNPSLLNPSLSTYNPIKYLHRLLMKNTYKKYLKFLSEIAIPPDRVGFFKENSSANIHLLNSLNFDFEWSKNKISKKEARKKLGLDPETFILFSSSRLVSEKQIDKMLWSLSELKGLDFSCIISGAGDLKYEKYLKDLVKKLSLDSKISFVGFLEKSLIDYYCAADVFITTSGSEAGPVSAIKAIALGIPVISTDTGIAAYLLKENNTGIILDKKNNAFWAEKIRSAISNQRINTIDPELLRNEYDLKNSIRQLVESYELSIENFRNRQIKYSQISSLKVIYIITFPPKYEYIDGPEPDFFWINKKNEKISVWRIDWGHIFARNVKKYFPEIAFEVWRPDYRADKEYKHIFEDGVIHLSFPARAVQFRRGLKKDRSWTSGGLLERLEQYIDQNSEDQDLILHLPVDFSYLSYTIFQKFAGKVPFLHTSHLNPSLLNPSLSTYNPIKYLHRLLMKNTYKKYLKFLSEIAIPPDRVGFFKENSSANIHLLNSLNFDFEWSKNKISKKEARKKLGLDPETFILFSSSRLVSEKQIDKMLWSLSELKGLDFSCIISGAGDLKYEQYLKNIVKKLSLDSKISFVGFLEKSLIDYYCAADVFITTSGSEAGPVSAIKAIALGIPVISTDTGIAAYLLKENNTGIILDKKNNAFWAEKIRDIIKSREIKCIDPEQLLNKYDLKNSIKQLVGIYKGSIKNFQTKKSRL